jgi:hypothetical protein
MYSNNDVTELIISYPIIDSPTSYIYEEYFNNYSKYFNQLNEKYNIYENTKSLFFETDYIWSLPSAIKKFKDLHTINISGCRFLELDMYQVPESVRVVKTHKTLNTDPLMLDGCENLIYLEELYLDFTNFNVQIVDLLCGSYEEDIDDGITPIPNSDKLRLVYLLCGMSFDEKELYEDYKSIIIDHKLFENIKHRIDNISYICQHSECYYGVVVEIKNNLH